MCASLWSARLRMDWCQPLVQTHCAMECGGAYTLRGPFILVAASLSTKPLKAGGPRPHPQPSQVRPCSAALSQMRPHGSLPTQPT